MQKAEKQLLHYSILVEVIELKRQFFSDHFTWAGTFVEIKDGLPYIEIHPDFDNTYFVVGFGD